MAVDLITKKSNFITGLTQEAVNGLAVIERWKERIVEWNSMGYSSAIVDGDCTGTNAYLDASRLAAVITSMQAVIDLLSANGNAHNGNLYKAKP